MHSVVDGHGVDPADRSRIGFPGRLARLPESPLFLVLSAAVFVVALGWHVHELHDHWREVGGDLNIYLQGGQRILHHQTLYLPRPPHAYFPGLFTYTPFAALLFTALPGLAWNTIKIGVQVADVLLVVACTWASLRLLGRRRGALAMTLLLSGPLIFLQPVHWTMMAGQINLIVLALVLGDALLPDSHRLKGVATGLAIAVKLTPAFFVLYLLLTRRVRPALTACATFAATIAFGFLLLPADSAKFWGGTYLDTRRVGPADYGDNQSLAGLLGRIFHTPDPPRAATIVVQASVALLGLALAVLAHRRGEELLALTTIGLTTLLISPISWSHHWVWLLPVFPYVIERALAARARVTTAVVLAAAAVAWYVLAPGLNGTRDIHTSPPYIPTLNLPLPHALIQTSVIHHLLVNVYVYAGLALLAAIAVTLFRGRPMRGPS